MSWKVIEYMDENPQAKTQEIIKHFAESFDIEEQLNFIKDEVEQILLLREELRPLYGKKWNEEMSITALNSQFEMEVMLKFPKGRGSEKDRKALRADLQKDSTAYQHHQAEISRLEEEIQKREYDLQTVEQRAKNARKLVDTFNQTIQFILSVKQQWQPASSLQIPNESQTASASENSNLF